MFFFFGWVSKISLFWQLGPKSAHTKNTIKIVVSGPFFLKSSCASRDGHFWTKKSQIHKFQLSFSFACFLLFQQHKTQTNCWNLYFYSVLANLKKENFQNLNLKHWKLKNLIFAPFFCKRLFLENCQKIGDKKKHKRITECAKQISWNHYFYRLKTQTWTR